MVKMPYVTGLYFDSQEIIPWALGEHRYDEDDKPIPKFQSPEIEIRALVEGQFIAKRAHAEDIGFAIGEIYSFKNFLDKK